MLSITNLNVRVPGSRRTDHGTEDLTLVHDLTLNIGAGERLALVGESGSGKSMTAKAILRLDPNVVLDGSIMVDNRELLTLSAKEMRKVRGTEVSMVFQDPMTALNPVLTIGDQVAEPLRIRGVDRKEAKRRALEILDRLGVARAAERLRAYPREFSGGMRQRVVLAAALIARPKLLVADEPTTALDVRVQEQVLDLIEQYSNDEQLSVLLITHDLSIVAGFAHRVAVMFRGQIVESQPVDALFAHPQHPYTRGLLGSIPRIDADPEKRLATVEDFIREGSASHV